MKFSVRLSLYARNLTSSHDCILTKEVLFNSSSLSPSQLKAFRSRGIAPYGELLVSFSPMTDMWYTCLVCGCVLRKQETFGKLVIMPLKINKPFFCVALLGIVMLDSVFHPISSLKCSLKEHGSLMSSPCLMLMMTCLFSSLSASLFSSYIFNMSSFSPALLQLSSSIRVMMVSGLLEKGLLMGS